MSPENHSRSLFDSFSTEEKVEALFKRFYPELCRGVNSIIKDEVLSEDIVQEVFIKIWERKGDLDLNDYFIFYLKKSCYNAALNTRKSLLKIQKVELSEATEAVQDKPDDNIISEQLEAHIFSAIQELPEKTRIIFLMSRNDGMTYKEIAQVMEVSVKAIEKHMGIALQRLRQSLKDYLVIILSLLFTDF